ncbi:NAD(P)H-binding protein [Pantoea osteomyelitidis]|uniref:NAD(P)H-binding protein n=1 Tax=Pantoea osteomyelitidis TaxID=3230026 RepID=A0ABW7Q119_9GAMM
MNIKTSACVCLLAASLSIPSHAQNTGSSPASPNQQTGPDAGGMKHVIIIGANGRTSAEIIPRLLEIKDVKLRLFLRQAERLEKLKSDRVELFEGDATRAEDLRQAIQGQDIVISTMGGLDLDTKTANIVKAMDEVKSHRLIVISAGGIWNELPEPFNTWDKAMVGSYRPVNLRTAQVVEDSDLDYTVLRPVWLNDKPAEKFTLTFKGEKYKGRQTSRASVARFIADIVKDPARYSRQDVGISQTGSD